MLIHMQMPGARFVAPPHRWLRDHCRRIKPGIRPLVILQPMGPVMFVFDVSDTEAMADAPPLPREVIEPFAVRKGHVGGRLELVIENAKRDGVRTITADEGSQSAGSICRVVNDAGDSQRFKVGVDGKHNPICVDIPVTHHLVVNKKSSREARYATIVHELAHLYCGHLGTPDPQWWPDRWGLAHIVREFEAESVAYMVCTRAGIDNPSEEYLAGFVGKLAEVPPISLDCVMKVAGLIETMSRAKLKPRKPSRKETGG
jgi:hypothetical protein